jgi:hypothetical protein
LADCPLSQNASDRNGSFAVPGKVITQHHYSADLVRRNGNPEIEQLPHIFTTLLPNSVGVGFNPSARLNSSV